MDIKETPKNFKLKNYYYQGQEDFKNLNKLISIISSNIKLSLMTKFPIFSTVIIILI